MSEMAIKKDYDEDSVKLALDYFRTKYIKKKLNT